MNLSESSRCGASVGGTGAAVRRRRAIRRCSRTKRQCPALVRSSTRSISAGASGMTPAGLEACTNCWISRRRPDTHHRGQEADGEEGGGGREPRGVGVYRRLHHTTVPTATTPSGSSTSMRRKIALHLRLGQQDERRAPASARRRSAPAPRAPASGPSRAPDRCWPCTGGRSCWRSRRRRRPPAGTARRSGGRPGQVPSRPRPRMRRPGAAGAAAGAAASRARAGAPPRAHRRAHSSPCCCGRAERSSTPGGGGKQRQRAGRPGRTSARCRG